MARPRNPSKHVRAAVDGLVGAMEGLLKTLGAGPIGGVKFPPELKHPQRGPGKGNPRLKSALKRSWAAYTPKQRAERIRKMLAGRGLRPRA